MVTTEILQKDPMIKEYNINPDDWPEWKFKKEGTFQWMTGGYLYWMSNSVVKKFVVNLDKFIRLTNSEELWLQ